MDVRSALKSLLDATTQEIRTLHRRAKTMPKILARGIETLPNELLARIFELSDSHKRDEAAEPAHIFRLGQVCRRFRQLVLGLPGLWAEVSTEQNPLIRVACLERSRPTGISVDLEWWGDEFDLEEESEEYSSCLRSFMSHKARWRSFNYHNSSEQEKAAFHPQIQEAIFDLHLPLLERLFVEYESRDVGISENAHFYASWSIPRLRSFESNNYIPPPDLLGSTLTSCDISIFQGFSTDEGACEISSLLQFLGSAPSLQELSLYFLDVSLTSTENITSVELPHLEVFSMTTQCIEGPSPSNLMQQLRLPKLANFSLSMSPANVIGLDNVETLLPFFPLPETAPIAEFSLSIEGYSIPQSPPAIPLILLRLPHLRQLSIDCPSASDYEICGAHAEPDDKVLPPLRTLRFQGCSMMDGSAARFVLKALEASGQLSQFESLEVLSCPLFKWQNITDLIPRSRILWRE